MESLIIACRLLLGAVLLMSGIAKLGDPRSFVENIQQYRILPKPLARLFGWLLPYVEIAMAVALLAGVYPRLVGISAATLLVIFMSAIGVAMVRKQNLNCSCFGLLYRERVGWGTQTRDGILVILAASLAITNDESLALHELAHQLGRPLTMITILFTASVVSAALAGGLIGSRRAKPAVRIEA